MIKTMNSTVNDTYKFKFKLDSPNVNEMSFQIVTTYDSTTAVEA